MMTGMIARAWQTVKPHVPMIKFRKGGSATGSSGSSTVQAAPAKGSAPKVSGGKSQQLPLIEDWQLPPRYRRRALDEKEIDAINSGGAY